MPYTPNADTQAYVDQAKNPSVQSAAQARNAIRAYADSVNKSAEQASVYSRLAQAAVLDEPDKELGQLLDEAMMHVRSIKRLSEPIVQHIRDLADAERQLKQTNARILTAAQVLGYVIPA